MEDFEKILRQEIAVKVIAALPEEQKQEIIARGIAKALNDIDVSYEIKKLLITQAMDFAREYIKRPEIQETLRQKTHQAIDAILEQTVKIIAKEAEDTIKSRYVPLFKE